MTLKNLGTMLTIIALTALLAGCDKESTKSPKISQTLPLGKVSVDRVRKRIAANQMEVVGTVQAVERAEISAKISGNIVTFKVNLGSKVEQGDLLVELSAGEISAKMQQAQAQLKQTKRNLAREESLLKKNATTPQTVKSLRDSTRIAEAAYREAVTMLDYTRLTAPFSGIITKKIGNVGDLATPGKPLLYIEEENNLQVLADIPEVMLLRVKIGDKLSVFVPSVNLSLKGMVAEVSPVADPSSRSAPIKLRVPSDPRLRSGQFARVTLALEQAETLTIPTSALIPIGQIERVFVKQDNKARLRLVRSGTRDNGNIEILSGLFEGETVITQGNRNLLDGQPVIIQ
ncbi:MAG: efflux RND transporter periplasmic adaptor subunit [Desulfobulbaceae bacterium]|nr:efflux RND transporter periplasmic adaptor subunit [Desulfobulbaceae bacterium]